MFYVISLLRLPNSAGKQRHDQEMHSDIVVHLAECCTRCPRRVAHLQKIIFAIRFCYISDSRRCILCVLWVADNVHGQSFGFALFSIPLRLEIVQDISRTSYMIDVTGRLLWSGYNFMGHPRCCVGLLNEDWGYSYWHYIYTHTHTHMAAGFCMYSLVDGVAQWCGRWSLASGLSLFCARSVLNRRPLCWQTIYYSSVNSAFHPSAHSGVSICV